MILASSGLHILKDEGDNSYYCKYIVTPCRVDLVIIITSLVMLSLEINCNFYILLFFRPMKLLRYVYPSCAVCEMNFLDYDISICRKKSCYCTYHQASFAEEEIPENHQGANISKAANNEVSNTLTER